MAYNFTNLIFEGGGVKGIAYVGAMEELARKGILPRITRVGGTSAGAINAVLLGLGYTQPETKKILWDLNFKKFMDDDWGLARDTKRLISEYGWYKGDFFRAWIGNIIKNKTGNANSTFADIEAQKKTKGFRSMYFMVTNLATGFSEVMSAEKTAKVPVADAVRMSMSIPFFFAAVKRPPHVYADGGILDNYPVKLFDREKYLSTPGGGRKTEYYDAVNKPFLNRFKASSPYIYNKETLGFRLDSRQEIAMFRDSAEPVTRPVNDFFDFIVSVVTTMLNCQEVAHLHSDDWQRTIYIDTLGVGTTEFDISDKKKNELLESGRKGVRDYFAWYDDKNTAAVNK